MKRLLFLILFCATVATAQQVPVTATVVAPNGPTYSFATGSANLVCPGNQQPTYNGSPIQRSQTITGFDGFGTFSMKLYDVNAIQPVGCAYTFAITDITGNYSFTTGLIGGAAQSPVITGSTLVDLSVAISAFAVPLPNPGQLFIQVNGVNVINPNIVNSGSVTWNVSGGSNIQATSSGGGGGGGGTPGAPANSVQFANAALNAFSAACISTNCFGVDSVTAPTNLNVPFNMSMSGTLPVFQVGTPGNAGAIVITNNTSGTYKLQAPPGIVLGASLAFLPVGSGTLLGTNATNTILGTIDLSNATGISAPNAFRLPNISGCTPTLFGVICFDTLNGNFVTPIGIAGMITGSVTPGHCFGVGGTSASPTLVDAGVCGAGGTPGGANFSVQFNNGGVFGGVTGLTNQLLVLQNGASPAAVSAGILTGNGGVPVTSTPYVVQCDNSTTTVDRAKILIFKSGASVVTMPDPSTAPGCGSGYVVKLIDDGAGTLTINRTTIAVFNIADGGTNTDGATSFQLTNGQYATLNAGDNTNWTVTKTTTSTTNGTLGQPIIGSGAGTYSTSAYLDCTQFTGSDDSIKLQNCIIAYQAINPQVAYIDGRGLCNATTWTTNPFAASSISASGTLLWPNCEEHTNVPIVVHNLWNIVGPTANAFTGQSGATVIAGASFPATVSTGTISSFGTVGAAEVITGSGTPWTSALVGCAFVAPAGGTNGGNANTSFGIIKSVASGTSLTLNWGAIQGTGATGGATYDIYCPLLLTGGGGSSSAGAQFGMGVSYMNFDCNNVAGCVSVMNWYGQQGTVFDRVSAHGFTNIGWDIEWQPQNFGPMTTTLASAGSGCTAGTLDYVFRASAEITRPVIGMSGGQGSLCGTQPTVAVVADTNNMMLVASDMERVTTAISAGANITCPVACPMAPKAPNGLEIVGGGNQSGVGTTYVHLSNFNQSQGPTSVVLHDLAQSGITNILVDDANGCTITDTRLGLYVTRESGKIAFNSQGTPSTACTPAASFANTYLTGSNCSSSASPAVCGSSAAGSVNIAAGSTTIQVNTTAVTANSQITLQADDTLGTKLGVTCNSTLATLVGGLAVTARTAGTSFTISFNGTIITNPLCLSYQLVN